MKNDHTSYYGLGFFMMVPVEQRIPKAAGLAFFKFFLSNLVVAYYTCVMIDSIAKQFISTLNLITVRRRRELNWLRPIYSTN